MKRLIVALAHPRQYVWFALRPWRRHSLVLLVAGILYVLIGTSYTLPTVDPDREAALAVALYWAPMPVWGAVWILTGLTAILSSRWPPASETWGYTVMSGTAALWSAFILAGVPLGSDPANITGALVFAVLAFLWWANAGLLNPEDWPAPVVGEETP